MNDGLMMLKVDEVLSEVKIYDYRSFPAGVESQIEILGQNKATATFCRASVNLTLLSFLVLAYK